MSPTACTAYKRTVKAESSKASMSRGKASESPICPSAKHAMARTGKVSSSRQPKSALTSLFAFDPKEANASAAQSRTSHSLSLSASEIFAMFASSPMRPNAETAAHLGRRMCGGRRRPPPPMTRARPEPSSLASASSSTTAPAHEEAFSPRVAKALAAAALTPAPSDFSSSIILAVAPLAEATVSAMPPMAATADTRVMQSPSDSASTTPATQDVGALLPIATTASSAAVFVRPLPSILLTASPSFVVYRLCISSEAPTRTPRLSTAAHWTSGTGSLRRPATASCSSVASISAMAWHTLMRTSGSWSSALAATTD
mmetsp:Transcript_33455/g.77716  ORF Transcript_33455/g.77716 Transcript_33455/m.77716 type:complete len:315 (+) Transcript_33455:591-1535(+)